MPTKKQLEEKIKELKKIISDKDNKIVELEIPTGNPLFISFDDKSKITKCYYLDKDRAKDLIVF